VAKKVYYQDRSKDILVTNEMARLGSDGKVWWIQDLDKAAVKTVRRVRWDIVVCAVVGGLLCEGCLIAGKQTGAGVLLAFILAVVAGLAVATAGANCHKARVRTRRWMVYEALESADRAVIAAVVLAVNNAIKDYRKGYNQPPPRDDVPL
jgi:hypothetical protein